MMHAREKSSQWPWRENLCHCWCEKTRKNRDPSLTAIIWLLLLNWREAQIQANNQTGLDVVTGSVRSIRTLRDREKISQNYFLSVYTIH